MTKTFRYVVPFVMSVFLSLGSGLSVAAETAKVLSENEAFDLLIQTIQHDTLYSSWTTIGCLRFLREETTSTYVDIAIHEKHEGSCPGDPNTAPVVDRFRVLRLMKKIMWYDVVNGEYVAYERIRGQRKN